VKVQEISDHELDHLIDLFGDKYRKYIGSNGVIKQALSELRVARAQIAMLRDANALMADELDDARNELIVMKTERVN
jgi:hypothetical protein